MSAQLARGAVISAYAEFTAERCFRHELMRAISRASTWHVLVKDVHKREMLQPLAMFRQQHSNILGAQAQKKH